MANSAYMYLSKSGNYYVSFHHPLCREGTIGKKIHRSLQVSDKAQADQLKREIDELLTIATDTPSLLPPRAGARYAPVVVDAFYDCMTPEPLDRAGMRDRLIEMPARIQKNGVVVARVLVVGATGVGKSRFLQHLLGTTAFNFPMRGAGRTTLSDNEIIVTDRDFSAAITFFSKDEIRQIISENIVEACVFAGVEANRRKIAQKLLVDLDKRFRFNFVLGELKEADSGETIDDIDDDADEVDTSEDFSVDDNRWPRLEKCVDQIVVLGKGAVKRAQSGSLETDLAQFVDAGEVDKIADEMIAEVEKRLCAATCTSSWPPSHKLPSSPDMAQFFSQLKPFYQNRRALFGKLVTPLVQGLRVQGRFYPSDWSGSKPRSWVFLDGQGVGHEQTRQTPHKIVPPDLARKFSSADVICLVDKSMPAMVGDAPILLEHLLTRGYLERIALVFTHFEAVAAPDLDGRGRKAKVLEGVSNAIQGIALPKSQKVLLEQTAEGRSYFLTHLDKRQIKGEFTKGEIRRLLSDIGDRTMATLPNRTARPIYNRYDVAKIVSEVVQEYRNEWSENVLARYNYKIVEALTNWIGNLLAEGYWKRGLYPGQSLSQKLMARLSIVLDDPEQWDPAPLDQKEQNSALNAVRTRVADDLDRYCRQLVVQDPRISRWLPAHRDIFGEGTQRRRARTVARILEDYAQLPGRGPWLFRRRRLGNCRARN